METDRKPWPQRSIRVQTLCGAIEGFLEIGPQQRTLDDLNRYTDGFIRIHSPVRVTGQWTLGTAPLELMTSAILWVEELSRFTADELRRFEAMRYGRLGVRLRIADYELRGFLHVPGQGDPMSRLHRDRNPFFALTSAGVIGPEREFAAPFLAVNRAHIVGAQTIEPDEPTPRTALERAEIGER